VETCRLELAVRVSGHIEVPESAAPHATKALRNLGLQGALAAHIDVVVASLFERPRRRTVEQKSPERDGVVSDLRFLGNRTV
jgi:hypothetical protein